jgi:hypothetical protein
MEVWSSVSEGIIIRWRADDFFILDPATSRCSPVVRNMEMSVGLTLQVVVSTRVSVVCLR